MQEKDHRILEFKNKTRQTLINLLDIGTPLVMNWSRIDDSSQLHALTYNFFYF